jgi:hypothetical protein
MKKILWLFLGVAIVGIGFYVFYRSFRPPVSPSLWDLVPADAVIVYENKKPFFNQKTNPDFTAYVRTALEHDSIFVNALSSKESIVSLHITGKEDFGMIYYQPDSTVLQHKFIKALVASSKSKKRIFDGYKITELATLYDGVLSYTTLGDNLVISRESLLIEDVIRSVKIEGKKGFRKTNNKLFQLTPSDAGQGNVYINLAELMRFCNLFMAEESNSAFVKNIGNAMVTDVKADNQTMSLNGFALDSGVNELSSLSLFNDQHPVPSEIRKIVSNRALSLIHYGISDFNAWVKRRQKFGKAHSPASSGGQSDPPFNHDSFYGSLGNEIGQCRMEIGGRTADVVIVEIKNTAERTLNTLLSHDKPVIENYANYPIRKTTAPELMFSLLWPLTENKNLSFYCRYDKYILFSENTDMLEKFLADIEEDNTWGKSVEWSTFFNATLPDNNVSLVVNGATLYPWLMNHFTPAWKKTIGRSNWNSLQKGSFQLTRLDANYYFNGTLQFDFKKKNTEIASGNETTFQITFPNAITSLSPVKNHSTGVTELFLQTSDETVRLISTDFKVLFTLKLNEKINGQVYQIDFYKNKKLQYLFLAGRTLYLIDRLGNHVPGFPKILKTKGDPGFLTVVDYDNERNYRFLFSDTKGNLYLTDKNGLELTGWNGKSAGLPLLNAPRAVRVLGKDFIVSVDAKGSVYAFARKGDLIRGFPVMLNLNCEGNWFFEKSEPTREGLLTVVSTDGTKVQVSLNGKTVSRENFVRSSADSKFSLITSSSLNDYVISRIDKKKIAVLGKRGEVIFEKENPGSESLSVRYLQFDSGQKVFCFMDEQQEFTYLFDEQGAPLVLHPLETTCTPSIVRDAKDGLTIFSPFRNQLKKVRP